MYNYYANSSTHGTAPLAVVAVVLSGVLLLYYPANLWLQKVRENRTTGVYRLSWAYLDNHRRLAWYSAAALSLAIGDVVITLMTPNLTLPSQALLMLLAASLLGLFVWIHHRISGESWYAFLGHWWPVWGSVIAAAIMAVVLTTMWETLHLDPSWPAGGRTMLTTGGLVAAGYTLGWILDWLGLQQDKYGLPIGRTRIMLPTGAIPVKSSDDDPKPRIFYGDAGVLVVSSALAAYALVLEICGVALWHRAPWDFHLALYATMGGALMLAVAIQIPHVFHDPYVRDSWQRRGTNNAFWLRRAGIVTICCFRGLWERASDDDETMWLRRLAMAAAGAAIVDLIVYWVIHRFFSPSPPVYVIPSPSPSPTSSSGPHSGSDSGSTAEVLIVMGVIVAARYWIKRKRKKR
jgi:hypothetical protein